MLDVLDFAEMKKTVLDSDRAVFYIPRSVKKVEQRDQVIEIYCQGWKYRKGIMDIWFNQLNPNLTPAGEDVEMIIRLEVKTERIIRIRLVRGDTIEKRDTPMVIEDFSGRTVDYDYQENEKQIAISTAKLNIEVQKEPINIEITDSDYRQLFKQHNYDRHAINELIKYQGEARYDYSSFEGYPFGLAEDLQTGEKAAFDFIRMDYNENFYGLGEKFTDLNKRGQEILCWQVDALGTSTQKSYKNIPFFISSRGYGLFLNTTYKSRYKLGDYFSKAYQIESAEGELDYYFIYGPRIKDILNNYTELTGRTPLPPRWSFGVWMSRNSYQSEAEIMEVARKFRKKEYPVDVLHLDVGWFENNLICDFEFDKDNFPNPEGMIEKLSRMGYKFSLWQIPYVNENSKIYAEGQEKGYFERFSDPANTDAYIDISNPEAEEWYQEKLRRLFQMGVSVIKADFGEGLEVDAAYEEYSGWEFHNLYPLLYNKMVFELTEEVHGKGNGIIWARSAYAGSQRYPLHWAGDSDSDFAALASTLKGGLSFGLSGFPFWSHDVGGYFMSPEPECYIRWLQLGMFSSHVRFHGTSPREPWHFGEKAEEVYKKFADIRYRLLPYIYSEAYKCTRESLPLMRPLVIEYEDDPTVANIDDQYLFGDNLLIAPILTDNDWRKVYLPQGEWLDFWTKESYQGQQWIDYRASLTEMPIFIKNGSIVPEGPERQYVGEKTDDPLTLNIYHRSDESYYYYDDNDQFTINCSETEAAIKLEIGKTYHNFKVKLFVPELINKDRIKGIELEGQFLNFTCYEGYLQFDFEVSGQQSEIIVLKK